MSEVTEIPQVEEPPQRDSGGRLQVKSTNAEIEERIEAIAQYIMANPLVSNFDIHKQFCDKFQKDWRQVDRYTTRARALIKKLIDMGRDEAAQLGKTVLLNLLQDSDPKVRLAAEESWRKIFGYGAPNQSGLEVSGGITFIQLNHVDPAKILGNNGEKKK